MKCHSIVDNMVLRLEARVTEF